MVRVNDILRLYRDRLNADAALEAWAQSNFGTSVSIFVGLDMGNPPGRGQCPLVILRPGTASEGQTVQDFRYRILVDFAVDAETLTESGKLHEYEGVYLVDDMRELVLQALNSASENVFLNQWEYTIEAVEFFPMIVAGFDLELIVPNVMGGTITI